MNADRTVIAAAKRALKGTNGCLGSVIISLQQTQHDNLCQLRIFARLDDVFAQLAKEMQIKMDKFKLYAARVPREWKPKEDVFLVPYSQKDGKKTGDAKQKGDNREKWDLRKGTKVMITGGRYENDVASIVGKDNQGHYRVQLPGEDGITKTMGSWFVEAAVNGDLEQLPLVIYNAELHGDKKGLVRPNDPDVGSLSGYAHAIHDCPHVDAIKEELSQLTVDEAKGILSQAAKSCTWKGCNNKKENWVCLKSRRVLCGRFANKHMVLHNKKATEHHITMGTADLSFWCYGCR